MIDLRIKLTKTSKIPKNVELLIVTSIPVLKYFQKNQNPQDVQEKLGEKHPLQVQHCKSSPNDSTSMTKQLTSSTNGHNISQIYFSNLINLVNSDIRPDKKMHLSYFAFNIYIQTWFSIKYFYYSTFRNFITLFEKI